ncbi:methyl-accepting chemotaxis protein [Thalassotalea profundi]|uniref:Methyl-accepting chemotaxis protein n=1 Tax=Thalassotalea profundi TaxID=2036687 RepID=A0ABQ3ILE9_9GAMM|nr:methyl-accepting chemotaxis protein [Thalassotalea profundi]GHE86308.1 methyl-accepting chemotaxis protein [Thalassotalea profundi]
MLNAKASIKLKLTIAFVCLILFCVSLLSYIAVYTLKSTTSEQSDIVESQLKKSVVKTLQLAGESSGKQISALLDENFSTTIGFAQVLQDSALPNETFSRSQVKNISKSFLASNKQISALYAQFEPDGYDNKDSENIGNFEHSSDVGTLETYWLWENGTPIFQETQETESKYITTLNENGIRESEWYLCSMDSLKPCALDPYLYEIEPGKSELMTSLTSPILVNGKFIGMVGVDINLPIIQQWLVELAKNLFDGQASVSLVSQKQLIVGSSNYQNNIGKNINAFSNTLKGVLDSKQDFNIDGNEWTVKIPIVIKKADTLWHLIISLPKTTALAPVTFLNEQAEISLTNGLIQIVIASIVLILISIVLGVWLANSISHSIKTVSGSIDNLSSNEGDLTQIVEVKSHQELIFLAQHLNTFINKLATIISSLKGISSDFVDQFQELEGKAVKIGEDTLEQQTNLESVATAINEMSATAMEVASLAANTASQADQEIGNLSVTQTTLQNSVKEVHLLADDITKTSAQISQVATRSQNVSGIISTIQSIAEQTNLLALNAAIEAARAGEQGRGFAVVADEVRTLAARTQTSTQEISDLIGHLQSDVDIAVTNLNEIQSAVSNTVEKTNDSYHKLSETMQGIESINSSVAQVATAAEEQSTVSEELNERVTLISDGSLQLSELGIEINKLSQSAKQLIDTMNAQLNKFVV